MKRGQIILPAFEGRGDFLLNYARKLAEQGFNTLAVDMYGDAKVASSLEECFNLFAPFSNDRELVRRRALLAYENAKQLGNSSTLLGALGFCFGGMCMLELARSGIGLHAGVSMHGGLKKSDLPTQEIKTKLLILHGFQDSMVPSNLFFDFAQEMKEAKNEDWIFTFFGDGKHSFTDPKTGTFDAKKEAEIGREYNERIAQYTFRYALDFFQNNLN